MFLWHAGTTLLVSPYLMHRDPRKWERAQEFRPQRWMTHLNASGQPHAYMSLLSSLGPNGSYLPFGAGPRCEDWPLNLNVSLQMLPQKSQLPGHLTEDRWTPFSNHIFLDRKGGSPVISLR